MQRALLVEFVNADQFPGRVSYVYPFLKGFLDEAGVAVRWVRLGISTTNLMEHQRDQITLADDELDRLVEFVRQHRPEAILATDPVFDAQAAMLAAAGKSVEVQVVGRSIPQFQGMRPFGGPLELDRPDFVPHYDWEPINEAAKKKEIDNIPLALVRRCGHQLPVSANPRFCGINDERVNERMGCSFCTSWIGAEKVTRPTPEDWIGRQLKGIAARAAGPTGLPNGVLLESLESRKLLRYCVQAMEDTGLTPHVQLLAGVRTDWAGVFEQVLREHYDGNPGSKLRVGVYASGIESFSRGELELYNKGTTPVDGIRAINTFRELENRYPGRFFYTGTTFLLFTPWTTPEDLHLNLGMIRYLRFMGKEGGNVFQSRLRLHPELSITSLAERDGLVTDHEPDPVSIMNRRKLFERELPWRFADPRLGPVSRIALRFDLLDEDPVDPLARKMRGILNTSFPTFGRHDLMEILFCAAEAIRAESDVLPEDILFERAVELFTTRRARNAGPADAKRYRIGPRCFALAELLARILPLVRNGTVRLISIDDVTLREAESAGLEGLHWTVAGLVRKPDGDSGTLLVASSKEVFDRRLALQKLADRADAVAEIEMLRGAPECCALAFARGPFSAMRLPRWAAFSRRNETSGAIPPAVNPLLVPTLSFVPCTPDCPEAEKAYRTLWDALDLSVTRDEAFVFSFEEPGDGAMIRLQVTGSDERDLRYASVDRGTGGDGGDGGEGGGRENGRDGEDGGDGPLHEMLMAGNQLRFVPGQVRIHKDHQVVALLTATHGVWFPERGFDPAFWRELGRAAIHVARMASAAPEPAGAENEDQSKLQFLLEKVVERFPDRFTGVSVENVQVLSETPTVRMRIRLAGRVYELQLDRRGATRSYAFLTDHFSVSFAESTPLENHAHQGTVMALARDFDRAVAHYAPDLLP